MNSLFDIGSIVIMNYHTNMLHSQGFAVIVSKPVNTYITSVPDPR